MLTMQLGCNESPLVNPTQTCAYAARYGVNLPPSCCPEVPDELQVGTLAGPFLSPMQDAAADAISGVKRVWWWDDQAPESGRFYGMIPLSTEGLFATQSEVTVTAGTQSCGGTLVYGQRVNLGYTITVEAMLVGESCCDVAYGFRALQRKLLGCDCGCRGTVLRFAECASDFSSDCSIPGAAPLPVGGLSPWRTLRNVKVIEGPDVVSGAPSDAGCGCGCNRVTIVRFVLRGDPGLLHDSKQILAPLALDAPGAGCELRLCDETCDDSKMLRDPRCVVTKRPSGSKRRCGCPPIISGRQCVELDFSMFPRSFPVELEPVIRSGATDLYDVEVRLWRKIPGFPAGHAAYTTCNMCAGFAVSYLPAQSVLRRSACDNSITATVPVGRKRDASSLLTTLGSTECFRLGCGDYVACIYSTEGAVGATVELNARTVWG